MTGGKERKGIALRSPCRLSWLGYRFQVAGRAGGRDDACAAVDGLHNFGYGRGRLAPGR